jgi:hypothetical protein
VQHDALGIEGVAGENGTRRLDFISTEIGDDIEGRDAGKAGGDDRISVAAARLEGPTRVD